VNWPTPNRKDHERFCDTEGWSLVGDAQGRTGTHHVRYEFSCPDGQVLRTRISHPVDRSDYGASMFSHILRDQLAVTAEEFWACVKNGAVPSRGGAGALPDRALPVALVHLLITKVKLSETDIAEMTRDQAVERLNQFWAEGS
jgi:hypothetical protein